MNRGGRLTTHVLDLMTGRPAEGMQVTLFKLAGGSLDYAWADKAANEPASMSYLTSAATNVDGRLDAPLLEDGLMQEGRYELVFAVQSYLLRSHQNTESIHSMLFEDVPIRFRITNPTANYHIPLLVAAGGYSTYRGS